MTPASAYRMAFGAVGETATFANPVTDATASVRVRPQGIEKMSSLDPSVLAGTAEAKRLRLIALAEDFGDYGAPVAGDLVTWRGRTVAAMSVDAETRSVAGDVMAYVIELEG